MAQNMTGSVVGTQGATGNYAPVNGLSMYYEIHGQDGGTGVPLVLVHGAFSAIPSSFGKLLPLLSQSRQVIGVELQGHGRTADIDRPMSIPNSADDVVALLRHLGIAQSDILGYSMGAAVALNVAIRYPDVVRKLVFVSATYTLGGVHPGLMEGLGEMTPDMMYGSTWHEEYTRLAPRQEFDRLFAKKTEMDRGTQDVPDEAIRSLAAPVLISIGDSDLTRPEHAVEMFRLLGGGVFGDMAGLPKSQLAVLPGTSHVSMIDRAPWLAPMITEFLDRAD
jgi:pimeloyl-ACP methyl ester carboxylesterase